MTDLEAHLAAVHGLGFTVVRGAVVEHLRALELLWEKADVVGPPGQRATRFGCLSNCPMTAQILGDGLVGELLARLGATKLVQDELNALYGESYWHRDGAHVPQHGYRAVLYLDPISAGAGAISVVPVSHLRQDCWDAVALERLSSLEGKRDSISACSVSLESVPGDLVLFHCGLIHGSFGGLRRRQVAFVMVGDVVSAADRASRRDFVLNRLVSGTVRFK